MKSIFFNLTVLFTILISIVSCSADDSSSTETSSKPPVTVNYNYNTTELETMALINKYRVSKGLNPLETINYVSLKSAEHDSYMISNNVVDHFDFEGRSSDIIKVLNAKNVGENVAYNYNSAEGALNAWLSSEAHRKNIEGNYTHFGIAVMENPTTGKKYYTNIFVQM